MRCNHLTDRPLPTWNDYVMRPHLASALIGAGLLVGLAVSGCSSPVSGSASGEGAFYK